jgi:pimeloyl-ACP methyl ester carboxylesterase
MTTNKKCTQFPYVEYNQGRGLSTIVFIAGFPDNELSSWGTIIPEAFKTSHHLIFLCLPGYSSSDRHLRPWAYNHDELQEMLDKTLSSLMEPAEKFHLVTHDWGSHIGTRYQNNHPHKVKTLTMFDVGLCSLSSLPLSHSVPIAAYQIWFGISYLLTQLVGLTLATIFFKIYFWIPVPVDYKPNPKKVQVAISTISPLMCYPYYYLLRELLTGGMNLPSFPSCPTMYLVSLFDF